jgi:hypothetical protein
MSANSYICDITTLKSRTVRTGILNAAFNLGVPLGFALSGQTFKHSLGHSTSYWISTGIAALGVIIVLVGVKDVDYSTRVTNSENSSSSQEKPGFCAAINPKNNFYRVLSLPFKKREGLNRFKIWALILAFAFGSAPFQGIFKVIRK